MPRNHDTGPVDVRIAILLGWTKHTRKITVTPQQAYRELESARGMFGHPDVPFHTAGVHEEVYWLDTEGRESASPDRWSEWLERAWRLFKEVPEGAIPFDTRWLQLDIFDAAWEIAHAFIRYKEGNK